MVSMLIPSGGTRRGMVFYLVIASALILFLTVYFLYNFMLQSSWKAHRFYWGEVARQLAESGLELVRAQLKLSQYAEIRDFLLSWDVLKKGSACGRGFSVRVRNPFLDELVRETGVKANVEVSIALEGFEPFFREPFSGGIMPDGREKKGKLIIISDASFNGVRYRSAAIQEVSVVSIVCPVLSKFTLFLRNRGNFSSRNLNSLMHDKKGRFLTCSVTNEPSSPVVLSNGAEKATIYEGKIQRVTWDPAELEKQGFIFLGGGPWKFNLAFGARGETFFGQAFELRYERYFDLAGRSGLPPGSSLLASVFGFFDGVYDEAYNFLGELGWVDAETFELIPEGSALLRLYGISPAASPTYVLGDVYRRYIQINALSDGIELPFLTPAQFASSIHPVTIQFDSFESYSQHMSEIVEEPYNRSFDYMATNYAYEDSFGQFNSNGTPFRPAPQIVRTVRVIDRYNDVEEIIYPPPGTLSNVREIIILNSRGDELFRGSLAAIEDTDFLRKKANCEFSSIDEFAQFLNKENGFLSRIVLIKGAVVFENLSVKGGGMILVEDTVTIRGTIQSASGPLTVVSLNGDVILEGGGIINASIIALKGRFHKSRSVDGFTIAGNLACGNIDLPALARGMEEKKIKYDVSLDPTDIQNSEKNYRIVPYGEFIVMSMRRGEEL